MYTLEQCFQSLRKNGQKLTPQRMEILRVLSEARAPLTARDVHTRVKKKFSHVTLDTVYRNLLMLTGTGFISHINLQNKGTARFEFQAGHHHHHAICLECGAAFCIDVCFVPDRIPAPKKDKGFKVTSHAFEVYGTCSKCAA
jgi:Fe2+ or Zn2+ uptake regulation protein